MTTAVAPDPTDRAALAASIPAAAREDSGVWVVVPAYREGKRLATTLRSLRPYARNVVVVDDGSPDDTYETAVAEGVWTLRHPVNCGQGAALQTGVDFAIARGARVIVTFDADGQHRPDEIDRLVRPTLAGEADVALGSRFLGATENITPRRWVVLKLGVAFTRLVSRIAVTDTHNGFRALTRDAARKIRIRENRMAHASEILHQIQSLNLRWVEIPVTVRYSEDLRAKGQSGWAAFGIAARFLAGNFIR